MSWETVIGLEIHVQLATNSKIFSGSDTSFGAEANTQASLIDLGMPGVLPVLNQEAVNMAIRFGLGVDAQIGRTSIFARKNYFYPDIPKGYQISQYKYPLVSGGNIKGVELTRIHLEEDTAKLVHREVNGEKVSLIDFNRSSVPLVEVVTEPDIKSGSQAKEYGKKLRQIMRFLQIADCDMEQGGMRLEANISVSPEPYSAEKTDFVFPTYKVEVKNINSFRFMEQAVNYELNRQATMLSSGETPVQETRGWDSVHNKTFSQRVKEDAADYRYFPDPDLLPLEFDDAFVGRIKASLPELPDDKKERFVRDLECLAMGFGGIALLQVGRAHV